MGKSQDTCVNHLGNRLTYTNMRNLKHYQIQKSFLKHHFTKGKKKFKLLREELKNLGPVFTEVLFIIAKTWKKTHVFICGWMNKENAHRLEYYSAIKRKYYHL